MFPLDNNSYPHFYHHQSPSFTNVIFPESNNTSLQHYHHHGKYNYILPITPTFSPIQDNLVIPKITSEPSIIHPQNSILCPSSMMINHTSRSRRAPGKKDRHTKISTAQGVRDRRVRLSMSIARDFFNLQDMLGFDKASKTLGWLMAKSKAAIDELTRTSKKKNGEKNIDENTNDDDNNGNEKTDLDANNKSSSNKKRNRRENNNVNNTRNVTMEMKRREEARNRARERTRNKKLGGVRDNQQLQQHHSVQQDLVICQSKADHQLESCNYYNDYFNKSISATCNYGGGFPALSTVNLSTEVQINDRPWDTYNNQFLH